MSNTKTKAQLEFEILDSDAVVHEFKEPILALVDAFGNSGQSGGSAPFYAHIISSVVKKLCMQEPIAPITGDDSEWSDIKEYGENLHFQNIRCAGIFKDANGICTYNDAIVWDGEDEYDSFTGWVGGVSSSQKIKFPFEPKTFRIDVIKRPAVEGVDEDVYEGDEGKYVYEIKDPSQLEQVWQHYIKPAG